MAEAAEIREKEERARRLMDEMELSALAFGTTANFAWFTCGGSNYVGTATETGAAVAVITRDAKYLVCDNIEAPRIGDEEIAGQGFEIRPYDWHAGGRDRIIAEIAGGAVGADIAIDSARSAADEMDFLRRCLTPQEIERYRALGRDTGECLAAACRAIEPRMTEHRIAAEMNGRLIARGIVPTVTLVAVDERTERCRHPLPTDKRLREHAMLITGARRGGLIVSTTRLVHFGPLNDELARKHRAVTRVDAALIGATTPGAAMGDVFAAGMNAYSEGGYPHEWRLHHQGGPTGYKGREFRVPPGCPAPVAENQAFAWNPSISGTKSEDTIIATSGGPQVLSMVDDWPTVDVETGGAVLQRPDILIR